MKGFTRTSVIIIALLAMAIPVMAGNTANQTVTYQVSAINEISVSGSPSAMNVNAATAGSNPDQTTDSSTTYAVTTNGTSKKLTAAINTDMPSGVTLKINVTAPSGGTSAGDVTLSSAAGDVVTGITTLAESGKTITYKLSAVPTSGPVAQASKTVTLTLTDGS